MGNYARETYYLKIHHYLHVTNSFQKKIKAKKITVVDLTKRFGRKSHIYNKPLCMYILELQEDFKHFRNCSVLCNNEMTA